MNDTKDYTEIHHPDLTTKGLGVNEEAAPLAYRRPLVEKAVPGTGVTGTYGRASFVMRFPDEWNGKVMIGCTPAVRNAFSLDVLLSDLVLQKGYAYMACDKATPGLTLRDPERSMLEWVDVYEQLTRRMASEVKERYGEPAKKTYVSGISNGGYVTRALLERHPELFDGGVEWEGALWAPNVRNLLTTVADYVNAYPVYADLKGGTLVREKNKAYETLLSAGLPPESEPYWETYYQMYWLVSLWLYGRNLDSDWEPFKMEWTNEWLVKPESISYPWQEREEQIYERTKPLFNTGKLIKPLLSVAGNWDCLLPFKYHAEAYREIVQQTGSGNFHRLYEIKRGNHVDGLLNLDQGEQQPVHPFYEATLNYLENWLENDQMPPESGVYSDIEAFYTEYESLKSVRGMQ